MSARSLTANGMLTHLAVLIAALAGLFAMHGLAAHGTTHAQMSQTTIQADDHAMHLSDGQPTDGDVDVLEMLCLALLVSAAIGLLISHARDHSPALRDPWRPALATATPTAARDRDPPDLHALSILRC